MTKNTSRESTPTHLSDRIIQDYIDDLLAQRDYYRNTLDKEKYNLSPPDKHFYKENRFIHGQKSCPPAYKKLKSASVSMLECEETRTGYVSMIGSFDFDRKNLKIKIPGIKGIYYLPVKNLIKLLKTKVHGCIGKLSRNEVYFIIAEIDKQLLLDYSIEKK